MQGQRKSISKRRLIVERKNVMNKTKKIVSSIAAVAMLTSVLCFGASAARTVSGAVGGYRTAGSCMVGTYTGSASTSFELNGAGNVSVNATYKYHDPYADTSTSVTKKGGSSSGGSVNVSFNTPNTTYKSKSIVANHSVSFGSGSWSDSTNHDR